MSAEERYAALGYEAARAELEKAGYFTSDGPWDDLQEVQRSLWITAATAMLRQMEAETDAEAGRRPEAIALRTTTVDGELRRDTPYPYALMGAAIAPSISVELFGYDREGLDGERPRVVTLRPAELPGVISAISVSVDGKPVMRQPFAVHGRVLHTICHYKYDPSELDHLAHALLERIEEVVEKAGGYAMHTPDDMRAAVEEIVALWGGDRPNEELKW